MIKENKRILMITSLIILLPVLVGMLLWHQLPEQKKVWQSLGILGGAFLVVILI